jgi:ribosome assembly protein SQT1
VLISHRNVIANTLQTATFEQPGRDAISRDYRDVGLGLLPQSHIYGLVIIAHASTWRGDQVIILPKFELTTYLTAIAKFKINTLYLVPPISITMANNEDLLDKYDLGSVRQIFSGAAPLAKEVADTLLKRYPTWKIRQAYGLTESCTVVTSTSTDGIWPGSSGVLLPGCEVKLVNTETGCEITKLNEAGEILVKSPAVVLGYLKNDVATQETFVHLPEGRFLRTGDKGEFRTAPGSHDEHLWIVDRIKELIKVKVSLSSLGPNLGQNRKPC